MRGVPIALFGSSFVLFSVLALSEAHSNEKILDKIEPVVNLRLTEEDKFGPRVLRAKTATSEVTEDRLKADGFLQDKHAQSSLEHDLMSKLKAIYKRYYELSDKLLQAEGHSSELTKQLMQTKLDLANYKVYKNDLLNRLKKTEMYLKVLLKNSQYHTEEHEVDFNHKANEIIPKKISIVGETGNKPDAESRSAAVTYGNAKEGVNAEESPINHTQTKLADSLIVEPHLDTKPHVASVEIGDVEKTINTESDSSTPNTETSVITGTVVLDSHRNQTFNNGTTKDVLAQIAFNFLRKPSTKPKTPEGPTLRAGLFDRVPENVGKLPSGPFVKNVTVVLRGASKLKDHKGVSLTDWDFGSDIGNMGFRIFESNSGHHHTNIEYRRGEPGSAGTPGIPGTPGSSGPAGPAGTIGTVGVAGSAGQKGESGTGGAGVNGVNGTAGIQGGPGFPGPSGPPGANGVPGVVGTPGVQGPMGAKGIKGIVGAPGP